MSLRPTIDAFYFPEQDTERPVSPRVIGSKLLEIMRRPEALVAEMCHLGLDADEIEAYTDLPIDTVKELCEKEIAKTKESVKVLNGVVQKLRDEGPDFNYDDIVLAGMVACEYSHWGVVRKNGKDYFTHPAAVAAIAESCWKVDLSDPQAVKRLQRIIFVALSHDTFEDSIPKDGASFLSDDIVITPRFVEELFSFYGRDDGSQAANDLLLLTKFRQSDRKISNDEYLERLSTSPDAVYVKVCDTQYNGNIDPKGLTDVEKTEIEKNERRAGTYKRNIEKMLYSLNDCPLQDQISAHFVSGITKGSFKKISSQLIRYRPSEYVPVYEMMHGELQTSA